MPENERNCRLSARAEIRQIPRMMTTFHRCILIVALGALASGCITTAESQAKHNEERCVQRGYKPGTDEFSDCVVRVDNERDQRMERNRRDMMEAPNTAATGNRGY